MKHLEEILLDEEIEEKILEKDSEIYKLTVHNDDVNTFDHVIETLMRVCNHNEQQAIQCTFMIHTKGKCVVKEDSIQILKPMQTAILDAGINATIN